MASLSARDIAEVLSQRRCALLATRDPDAGKVEMIIDAGQESFGPWHGADEIIDASKDTAKDS